MIGTRHHSRVWPVVCPLICPVAYPASWLGYYYGSNYLWSGRSYNLGQLCAVLISRIAIGGALVGVEFRPRAITAPIIFSRALACLRGSLRSGLLPCLGAGGSVFTGCAIGAKPLRARLRLWGLGTNIGVIRWGGLVGIWPSCLVVFGMCMCGRDGGAYIFSLAFLTPESQIAQKLCPKTIEGGQCPLSGCLPSAQKPSKLGIPL